MALHQGPSILVLAGLVSLLTGTVLHIVGQSTSEWFVVQSASSAVADLRKDSTIRSRLTIGLWKGCYSVECFAVTGMTAELKACEAFALLGICASLAAFCLAFYNFKLAISRKPQHEGVPTLVLWSSIVAALFILICLIVWGATIYDSRIGHTGYSLLLSIIGGLFIVIGGGLVFVGSVNNLT
ncbi:unnamed protein product [Candidula unifasciata]|uniref:Claudin n=1 Tax=Candidula unifasciata TaxID=100452 RepID=A0A8S3YQX8_9EUPU|nr:unnamed protein product [Candidula unifasciata]